MSDVEFLPLTGDPTGLRAQGHRASRAAQALDEARAGVRRVADSLAGERSEAVRAARLRLALAVDKAQPFLGFRVNRTLAGTTGWPNSGP
jgi:hypothetical protein